MNAIEFHNVTKRYRKGDSVFSKQGFFRAVDDVTFSIPEGQTVGLIGRNGCGKTTLLSLAAGITAPTTGRVLSRGKVLPLLSMDGCLINLFDAPKNIRFMLSLHGLRPSEIRALLPLIFEFSGLGDFPEMPIKNYSSGMRARLSFSIAVHLPMDVLLVDETLSVGDEGFRVKSSERLAQIRAAGKTILLASHMLPDLRQICDRVIWLEKGRVMMDGNPGTVIDAYSGASRKARP